MSEPKCCAYRRRASSPAPCTVPTESSGASDVPAARAPIFGSSTRNGAPAGHTRSRPLEADWPSTMWPSRLTCPRSGDAIRPICALCVAACLPGHSRAAVRRSRAQSSA
eukprot:3119425-Prymnesium_polylepis.2